MSIYSSVCIRGWIDPSSYIIIETPDIKENILHFDLRKVKSQLRANSASIPDSKRCEILVTYTM